ncbi:MAG: NAD(P)-dependent oxidoreductase [Rhizobiaceae bacterium]
MRVGFIGLGNAGGALAGNLLANGGFQLAVHDLDSSTVARFVADGALDGGSPRALAEASDIIITCLPSPAASRAVLEGADGILEGIGSGKVWLEMSTTDADEIRRLVSLVEGGGSDGVDCPVSGGVHRAATGNISIFAGCRRDVFERVLPVLRVLGRNILHTGGVGTASTLKVMTNYLATANLLTLCEALVTMKAAGMDLATTYEAIRISSGNSFVHETESQVILNGSRDISFSMDLVQKDIGLFQKIASDAGVPLEISPLMIEMFRDGQRRYGNRANSDDIIRRLEEATGLSILAEGFPPAMVDAEPFGLGEEIVPRGRAQRS